MQNHEVIPAFENLLDEIADVVNGLNLEGAQLLATGKYDQARELIEKVESINAIREQIAALGDQWRNLGIETKQKPVEQKQPVQRKMTKMLKQGLRTPNEAFLTPILQALVQLGGAGRVKDVLERVEEIMSDQLNKYDYQSIPSNPNIIRWQNNAQWARLNLVQEGLLASDSPRGIWEITEAGRNALKGMENQIYDQKAIYSASENTINERDVEPIFELHKVYHRQTELHDQYGGKRQSGIAPCAKLPYIFLFTSPTGDEFGYQDGWRLDDEYVYMGEGQLGDMEMTRGNLAILNHKTEGRALYLFKKVSSGLYGYVGEFEYQSHEVVRGEDTEGKERDVIRFVLKRL